MVSYLACMRKVKGMNDPECRNFAKAYLTCRMDKYAIALFAGLRGVVLTGAQ